MLIGIMAQPGWRRLLGIVRVHGRYPLGELLWTLAGEVVLLVRIGLEVEEPSASGWIALVELPALDERGARDAAAQEERAVGGTFKLPFEHRR
jgi:hypothetical protein